jgi:NAD(P)H-hydrate epimerase
MQLLVTAGQMQEFDRAAIRRLAIPGLLLMENAGRAFVDQLQDHCGPVRGKTIHVVCGKGNNGGDGFVIARHLVSRGALVRVLLLARPSEIKGDAAVNLASIRRIAAVQRSSLTLISVLRSSAFARLRATDIVIDAVFGTGFSGLASGIHRKAIDWMNAQKSFIAAVDMPSGVDGSTGTVGSVAVHAALTVTMGLAKVGHYIGDGRDCSGEIRVVDISIPAFVFRPSRLPVFRMCSDDVALSLPKRPVTAHKYSVGKVLLLGGSRNFTGAPAMAAQSALLSGAGAVILGLPISIQSILARKLTEVILAPLPETPDGTLSMDAIGLLREKIAWADTVALGPGLSRNEETDRLLRTLIPEIPKPLVIDADALTALSSNPGLLRKRKSPTILTPHAGELSRMISESAADIELHRVEVSRKSAIRLKSIIVLKGSPTATATPAGDVVLNSTGNPGMATVGSGDVLTGIVAGLCAQGMDPAAAAAAGVFVHGRAADIAAEKLGQKSLLALDIQSHISAALREFER